MPDALKPWLIIRKPKNALEKPITVDPKALYKSLLKMTKYVVAIHAGTPVKPEEIIPDFGEMLSAFGLKDAPEELAGKLVTQAVTRAILELLKENAILLNEVPKNPKAFDTEVDIALISEPFSLDRTFFKHPENHAILPAIKPAFETYLLEHGMVKERVATVAGRLPAYYAYALNADWIKNSKHYDPVKSAMETPFADAVAHQAAWDSYATFLKKQTAESLFQESFGLEDVYVPLRAFWEEKPQKRDEKPVRHLADLRTELDAWIAKGDKNDAIRVISGGPGIGKSSFGKMFAAHRAAKGDKVLFVPLHLLSFSNDLETSVHKYVRDTNILPHKPLDQQEGDGRLLLLFDGLDELAMQGKAAREAVQVFVREVCNFVRVRNLTGLRVQTLLAGRDIVIQDNSTEFKQDQQILHVLPYYLNDQERSNFSKADQDKLKKEDQRNLWWRAYGSKIGTHYREMPEELARPELDEITAQPLLNYLVALSYQRSKQTDNDQQDTIDFSTLDNRNKIYADLLKSVYTRPWGQGGNIHASQVENFDDYCELLEEIALAIWHGDGRTTTEKAILKRCEEVGIADRLTLLEKEATAGVTKLLVAFFFRQHGRETDTNERTFEFTHKSFGEYLMARRIVRALELMREERERRVLRRSGWTEEETLKRWAEWCGPTAIDLYLLTFLRDEVRAREDVDKVAWQRMMADLISYMLENGMPMENLKIATYQEMQRQARNAEEALLAVHSACMPVHEATEIRCSPPHGIVASWLNSLFSSLSGGNNGIARNCLNHLNLTRHFLGNVDLFRANLQGAQLAGTYLQFADLQEANLQGAYLKGAYLTGVTLRHVDMQFANLTQATLRRADLQFANLTGAKLEDADLEDAYLIQTNFDGANLIGADLQGARLEDTCIRGANIQGVNLSRTIFSAEQFKGALNLELTKNLHQAYNVPVKLWSDGKQLNRSELN